MNAMKPNFIGYGIVDYSKFGSLSSQDLIFPIVDPPDEFGKICWSFGKNPFAICL
jgi:hypothetical protein